MADITQNSVIRTPNQLLTLLDNGSTYNDLQDAHKEMLLTMQQAVIDRKTVKPSGTITLKLKYNWDSGKVDIVSDLNIVLPKIPRGRDSFYLTDDNDLTLLDPRQLRLGLQDVSVSGTTEVVDASTGEVLEEPIAVNGSTSQF